jgi:fibronectin type 3 domain-containing protein
LPSDPAAITPADTFAPAVPGGLTAVALGPTVDLSWTRNKESDLAGYNLFRGEDDRPLTVYAEGVALPTFADRNVGAGKRYRYAVSAVDKKGNQSGRSPEVAVRVE